VRNSAAKSFERQLLANAADIIGFGQDCLSDNEMLLGHEYGSDRSYKVGLKFVQRWSGLHFSARCAGGLDGDAQFRAVPPAGTI
jgi:hypothetical protein